MFKSIGHFFATFFGGVLKVADVAAKAAPVIEGVTALIPVYGPLALTIEKAGEAALGELSAVINSGNAAAKQHLKDAGLDANVIATVEAILAKYPNVSALAAVAKVNPTSVGEVVAGVASAV